VQPDIPVKGMDPKKFTDKFSLGNQKIMIDIFSFSIFNFFFLVIYINIYNALCWHCLPTKARILCLDSL
jgi:hypothetical protein